MNKLKFRITVLFIVIAMFLPVNNALAIGKWIKGTVTRAPWKGGYLYIKIDNVRYTIMKNADAVYVYSKNGAAYKDNIQISSIRRGDILLAKVEGNRIYQIEKIREGN